MASALVAGRERHLALAPAPAVFRGSARLCAYIVHNESITTSDTPLTKLTMCIVYTDQCISQNTPMYVRAQMYTMHYAINQPSRLQLLEIINRMEQINEHSWRPNLHLLKLLCIDGEDGNILP